MGGGRGLGLEVWVGRAGEEAVDGLDGWMDGWTQGGDNLVMPLLGTGRVSEPRRRGTEGAVVCSQLRDCTQPFRAVSTVLHSYEVRIAHIT